MPYEVQPVAWVESPLKDRALAPRQGYLGAPAAWLAVEPHVAEGIRDLRAGEQVIVLTWLDRARRDELSTVPGDNPASPPLGVFSTRSPDRPNPIGLHRVQILAVDGLRIQVAPLEALDGTPVLDIKPVLDKVAERQASTRGREATDGKPTRGPTGKPLNEVSPGPRTPPQLT